MIDDISILELRLFVFIHYIMHLPGKKIKRVKLIVSINCVLDFRNEGR